MGSSKKTQEKRTPSKYEEEQTLSNEESKEPFPLGPFLLMLLFIAVVFTAGIMFLRSLEP